MSSLTTAQATGVIVILALGVLIGMNRVVVSASLG